MAYLHVIPDAVIDIPLSTYVYDVPVVGAVHIYPCPAAAVIPVNVGVVGIIISTLGIYNLPFSVVVHCIPAASPAYIAADVD